MPLIKARAMAITLLGKDSRNRVWETHYRRVERGAQEYLQRITLQHLRVREAHREKSDESRIKLHGHEAPGPRKHSRDGAEGSLSRSSLLRSRLSRDGGGAGASQPGWC